MYNTKIAIQGLMGFKDINLDLSDIKGNLIAVVGENGAGKSTLLESIGFAGLYRTFPSREQGIHKYCNGNDSFIENEFTFSGVDYRTKILINAAGTRVEAYLFENGKAVNDGKTGSFDAEITKRFGSSDLILSSVFSAQNSVGSFLSLPRPKRKDLFISMLNLGILQDISTYSDLMFKKYWDMERDLTIKIDSLSASCAVTVPDKDILTDKKIKLEYFLREKEASRDDLKKSHAEIKQYIEQKESTISKLKLLSLKIAALNANKDSLESKIESVERDLEHNLIDQSQNEDSLKAEAQSLPEWQSLEASVKDKISKIEFDNANIEIKYGSANRDVSHIRSEIKNRENDLLRCRKDSDGLRIVPCGGVGEFAVCPLIKNSVEQKGRMSDIEQDIRSLKLKLNDEEARLGTIKLEKVDTLDLKVELGQIQSHINSARAAETSISNIQRKRQNDVSLSKLADELSLILYDTITEIKSKEDERDSISSIGIIDKSSILIELMSSIGSIEKSITETKEELHKIIMELGKVDIIKANVQSAKDMTEKFNKELKSIRVDKSEWNQVSYSFGPKAIQALEIDSAGPWVSDIINDLLRSCFGTRFSIKLITQAMKANKSETKDFFDLEVIDSEKNRTGLINDLSGGEKVICGEAVSLAIALYNASVGGVKWDTLFRDECSGALSTKNALLYIKMLRRAIELGKFKRCFFIAHQTDLVDAADNQIIIDGGISIK